LLGPGPRLIKKNLPGRGLTNVEKHWTTYMLVCLQRTPRNCVLVRKIELITQFWDADTFSPGLETSCECLRFLTAVTT
jgi:hypothetical protein